MPGKISVTRLVIAAALAAMFVSCRSSGSKNELKISGTVEATTVELSFKVGGRLAKRLVDEGMQVAAGQTVALLEDDELKEERSARSADEKAVRAGLADLQAGSRLEEIAQGQAALVRMKADADKLARDAERAENLFKREVIPRKELDAARAGREASVAAVHEAEQHLKLLKAGPRPDAVTQAKARVDASSAGRALAETRLSQTVLIAPVTGLVLAKHAEAGEMLAPGAPVVTIAKMDEVWLRGYIPEGDLGRVKVGQQAKVSIDSWPGRVFEGRVSFIASEAEFTPKNVQTEKERVKLVYRIKITLANPKGELKPGMPADAVIVMSDEKH
ncbi:MAG: efflux RND transporter periplasmic adaptor subunit [Desulfuromonadales bacterium]|nr:efflux RND transporter periplasmic adaptor subunit [Desulfuromonadales bacterium]